jgi:hypothetical protein
MDEDRQHKDFKVEQSAIPHPRLEFSDAHAQNVGGGLERRPRHILRFREDDHPTFVVAVLAVAPLSSTYDLGPTVSGDQSGKSAR